MNGLSNDLQSCLTVQPKRKYLPASKKSQQLAEELLVLVKGDKNRVKGILQEILYYSPNKPIEWYYEQAINRLSSSK